LEEIPEPKRSRGESLLIIFRKEKAGDVQSILKSTRPSKKIHLVVERKTENIGGVLAEENNSLGSLISQATLEVMDMENIDRYSLPHWYVDTKYGKSEVTGITV